MHLHLANRLGRYIPLLALLFIASAACQQQNVTSAPEAFAIWADPLDENSTGQTILDANDDESRFIRIDDRGLVVFSTGDVCNDCTTELETATIDLGNENFIDLRFSRGPDDAGTRRIYLVDAASGNYVQLLGSGPVTFQVTEEVFEEENDDTDDRAVFVRTASASSSSSASSSPLCGILGGGSIGLFVMALLALNFTRRSLRRSSIG